MSHISQGGRVLIILIVDDYILIATAIRNYLEKRGYKAVAFSDPSEAIGFFESSFEEISVVLLDLDMPTMSGEEFFERARSIDPEVPILLVTGESDWDRIKALESKGVSGVIYKPFTMASISEKIGHLIAQ